MDMSKKFVHQLIKETRGEITCADSFGRIIWAIVLEFRKFHEGKISLSPKDHSALSKAMNQVLRSYTDDKPEFVSKRVADVIHSKSIKTNPFDISSTSVGKIFGTGIKRSVVYEHVVPVKQLMSQLLLETKSVNDVCNLLSNYPGTALITTDEDECLTSSGARQKRDNWKKSYENCYIELLDENEFPIYIVQKTNEIKALLAKIKLPQKG